MAIRVEPRSLVHRKAEGWVQSPLVSCFCLKTYILSIYSTQITELRSYSNNNIHPGFTFTLQHTGGSFGCQWARILWIFLIKMSKIVRPRNHHAPTTVTASPSRILRRSNETVTWNKVEDEGGGGTLIGKSMVAIIFDFVSLKCFYFDGDFFEKRRVQAFASDCDIGHVFIRWKKCTNINLFYLCDNKYK